MKKTLLVLAATAILATAAVAGGVFALERHYLREARAQATAKLRDPDGALFRNVQISLHDRDIFGYPEWVACGEMNARNGLGGFEGYRPFYSGPLGTLHVETPDDIKMHAQACGPAARGSMLDRVGHARRAVIQWWGGA